MQNSCTWIFTNIWCRLSGELLAHTNESRYHVDMWGRMCTTGVGPAGSVDRAEDTVGVVLCLLFEIVS
jgi:hypothetical protein